MALRRRQFELWKRFFLLACALLPISACCVDGSEEYLIGIAEDIDRVQVQDKDQQVLLDLVREEPSGYQLLRWRLIPEGFHAVVMESKPGTPPSSVTVMGWSASTGRWLSHTLRRRRDRWCRAAWRDWSGPDMVVESDGSRRPLRELTREIRQRETSD